MVAGLPYPILIPMMVGTAMSLEKSTTLPMQALKSADFARKMLQGDFESKERIIFWAVHQLARKMNLIQMAEVTQSCPNLQGILICSLVRMRNITAFQRQLVKSKQQKESSDSYLWINSRRLRAESLMEEKKVVEKDFERELQVIYAATLLSSDPSRIYQFVKNYPVYEKDGDLEAAVSALEDLKIAMSHGKNSLQHLLKYGKPIHEEGPFLSGVLF